MELELAVPGPDGEPGYVVRRAQDDRGRVPRARLTFAAPLRVRMRLKIKSGEAEGELKEQDIFMGDFPLMTENGTFIINGAERVVVSPARALAGRLLHASKRTRPPAASCAWAS